MALSGKKRRFVDEYFQSGLNATEAARRSGYGTSETSNNALSVQAYRLMNDPAVKAEIERRMEHYAMPATEVLARLTELARGDMGDFLNREGNAFDLESARASGKTALIEKLRTVTHVTEKSTRHTVDIKLYSALEALKQLGRFHKLWVDRIQTEDWRTQAIADIRAGHISYEALAAEDETLAQDLFREAGVPVQLGRDLPASDPDNDTAESGGM